jgi:propanol-preferring alcohol dehydrogenase
MTRSREARALALELGADSAAGANDPPPEPLDGALLFAPVGTLVPVCLAALDRGGRLAVAGIHSRISLCCTTPSTCSRSAA